MCIFLIRYYLHLPARVVIECLKEIPKLYFSCNVIYIYNFQNKLKIRKKEIIFKVSVKKLLIYIFMIAGIKKFNKTHKKLCYYS